MASSPCFKKDPCPTKAHAAATLSTFRGMRWMTLLEIIATLFGLTCVALTIRQNIWCWPTGLVQVGLYIWIFYQARLYSDMGLHVIYVGLGVYGWWYWLRGGTRSSQVPVTRLTIARSLSWLAVGLTGAAALGMVMNRYTDAALPYWDATTTTLSLVAQYLMARKRLES
ncbi:MAG: nicotinamide riboside transporter PnuC, partial [Rhodospirillales bacterium]|nr:nicotinamide riboside transporter PnuC [Rhodospirillales bacterium]